MPKKLSHWVHPCVCSRSPSYELVQYIKIEILNRDVADYLLHYISFYKSDLQKCHWHLWNIFPFILEKGNISFLFIKYEELWKNNSCLGMFKNDIGSFGTFFPFKKLPCRCVSISFIIFQDVGDISSCYSGCQGIIRKKGLSQKWSHL